MSVNDQILDAIEMLAQSSVKKAGYDRTIQAKIVSCVDQSMGKYKCRYQDAIIYAFSNNIDIVYADGDYVYITIPNNDMSQKKMILGSTKQLGINYITEFQDKDIYQIVGKNCLQDFPQIYLNTINKDYVYTLDFDPDPSTSQEQEEIEVGSWNQDCLFYFPKSEYITIYATFLTKIPKQRRMYGNFGIALNLKFKNSLGEGVIRRYELNQNDMIGIPYQQNIRTVQSKTFKIDGVNFLGLKSIQFFNNQFPGGTKTGWIAPIRPKSDNSNWDIEISNIQLYGANQLTQEQINGMSITFQTEKGIQFGGNKGPNQLPITAQVRYKNKLVDEKSLQYYWGIQDASVFSSSSNYNQRLGKGFYCLNNYTLTESVDTSTSVPSLKEWTPGKKTYYLSKDQVRVKQATLRVAVVYNKSKEQRITYKKDLTIYNVSDLEKLSLVTLPGGNNNQKTLQCNIQNKQDDITYSYHWAYVSNTGVFTALEEAKVNNIVIKTDQIDQFRTYKCTVRGMRNETGSKEFIVGTASAKISNAPQGQSLEKLVITNGDVVFQYDEAGITPTSSANTMPQVIQALGFIYYDEKGQAVDSDTILRDPSSYVRWKFPLKNTMLQLTDDNGEPVNNTPESVQDVLPDYYYYDRLQFLTYDIKKSYNPSYKNNTVELTIKYKDRQLTAYTNFFFVQQGDSGTNGTGYVVRLVPNAKGKVPYLPILRLRSKTKKQNTYTDTYKGDGTYSGDRYELNYDTGKSDGIAKKGKDPIPGWYSYRYSDSYQFFKCQVFYYGQLVWEGFSVADEPVNGQDQYRPVKVHWEILANKGDTSAFQCTNADNGSFKHGIYYCVNNNTSEGPKPDTSKPKKAWFDAEYDVNQTTNFYNQGCSNIIKCTITFTQSTGNQSQKINKQYYGTAAIATEAASSQAKLLEPHIQLKENTGFLQGVYTADGTNPKIANLPFQFITTIWDENKKQFVDATLKVKYFADGFGQHIILDKNQTEKLQANQFKFKLKQRYDGFNVNQAVCCKIYEQYADDSLHWKSAEIHIPIHLLLNKYGFDHLNEWDGNSIQINEDGQYILSPQIGAGSKNDKNQFTGLLMGQVKDSSGTHLHIGLLGYNQGQRTIFLNSQNGSAIFGKSGAAQIVLDPATQKGYIYSGNYWNTWQDNGLPSGYEDTNKSGQGMLIDLTTPQIKFGSGHFSVDSEGNLVATGGGTIAGWKIGTNELSSANGDIILKAGAQRIWLGKRDKTADNTKEGQTTNDNKGIIIGATKVKKDDNGKITDPGGVGFVYSGAHNKLSSTEDGFYLSYNGLSIGSGFRISTVGNATSSGTLTSTGKTRISNDPTISTGKHTELGKTNNGFYLGSDGLSFGSYFKVTKEGILTLGAGAVDNKKSQHWTINSTNNNSFIGYNTIYLNPWSNKNGQAQDLQQNSRVYLGTDGISIGTKFKVTNTGVMYIGTDAVKYDPGTEHQEKRPFWTINGNADRSCITYNCANFYEAQTDPDKQMGTARKVYIGTDGIMLGSRFSVDNQGNLIARNGQFVGTVTATSGKIGNWTLKSGNLEGQSSSGNKLILDAGSSTIKAIDNNMNTLWSIAPDGGLDGSLTGGGVSFGAGGLTSGELFSLGSGGALTIPNTTQIGWYDKYGNQYTQGMTAYFDNIVTNTLDTQLLKVGGETATWYRLYYVQAVTFNITTTTINGVTVLTPTHAVLQSMQPLYNVTSKTRWILATSELDDEVFSHSLWLNN